MGIARLLLRKTRAPQRMVSILEEDEMPKDLMTLMEQVFPMDPLQSPAMLRTNTLEDIQLSSWSREQAITQGGRHRFHQMLSHPTTSIALLTERQDRIRRANPAWAEPVREAAGLERDLLWIYTLPERMDDAWPLPLLFPTWPLFRKINHSHRMLCLYHVYRIWMTPLLQCVVPAMSLLGPWFYMRYRVGWKLTLMEYFQLIKFLVRQSMASANAQERSSRLFTIAVYALMFVYGIIQTVEVSRMLHTVTQKMKQRVRNIQRFVDLAYDLVSQWDPSFVDVKPRVPDGMAGLHALWLDASLRDHIAALVRRFYDLDVSLTCRRLVDTERWCYVRYTGQHGHPPTCFGMRNPILPRKQTSNPMCLSKNLVMTGPNAAGKSTYVRSICANMLCSQSLGICCARRMEMSPVSAILSYMRVVDVVGSGSLFEMEVAHCSDILRTATDIQRLGGTAVIFFDEPMHSTPPLEGEAAAYAVLEHLGNLSNIRTVVTSHYHRLTRLPSERWTNVSMEAIQDPRTQGYRFPYRIRPGPSFQSIALELLQGTDKLPASVVQNAIKFKSSLCNHEP